MDTLHRWSSSFVVVGWAGLRVAGALVLLAVFAMSAMGVWTFIALFLGLSLDENAMEGGPSTLTVWEYALVYGAASVAAVAVLTPGLIFAWRLLRLGASRAVS